MKHALLNLPILCASAVLWTGCSAASETAIAAPASASSAAIAPTAKLVAQLPPLSGANVWTVDYSESALQFRAKHVGEMFTGSFSQFAAAIKLDPDNPADGTVHVVVDVSSIDAKDDDRNANLPEKNWFNVAQFPMAIFKSSDIQKTDAGGYIANGTLSIKGISQSSRLNFTLDISDDDALAKGETRLMRPDFKLGTDSSDFANEDWVGFPVKVMFTIAASR